jgi:hypothetical protein
VRSLPTNIRLLMSRYVCRPACIVTIVETTCHMCPSYNAVLSFLSCSGWCKELFGDIRHVTM